MMRDKFANYVVQKAVEMAGSPLREALIAKIFAIPEPNNYSKVLLINSSTCIQCCK